MWNYIWIVTKDSGFINLLRELNRILEITYWTTYLPSMWLYLKSKSPLCQMKHRWWVNIVMLQLPNKHSRYIIIICIILPYSWWYLLSIHQHSSIFIGNVYYSVDEQAIFEHPKFSFIMPSWALKDVSWTITALI